MLEIRKSDETWTTIVIHGYEINLFTFVAEQLFRSPEFIGESHGIAIPWAEENAIRLEIDSMTVHITYKHYDESHEWDISRSEYDLAVHEWHNRKNVTLIHEGREFIFKPGKYTFEQFLGKFDQEGRISLVEAFR